MLKRLKNRKGFTLIELMIVVAILGILAAVAVPVFLKYIRDSKTAEAEENLKSLGDGALIYYQEEHADTVTGLTVTTRVYPSGSPCTLGNQPSGDKVAPNSDWDVWKDLRFNLSKPHYYQYCYGASGTQKEFTASATATLDGGTANDSVFEVRGATSTATGGPELSAIIDLSP